MITRQLHVPDDPNAPPFLRAASQLSKEDFEDARSLRIELQSAPPVPRDPFDMHSPVSRLRGIPPGNRRFGMKEPDFLEEFSPRSLITPRAAGAGSHGRTDSLTGVPPAPTPQLVTASATSLQVHLHEDKATMVKNRLKLCGLSEELIDLMRPTIEREQMAAIWNFHDKGKLHTLAEPEARHIAIWLYQRIPILFRDMMKKANPTKTTKELNAMAIEHLVYLMPGNSEDLAAYFIQSLEFNDGRISKEDFVKSWNRHARLIFPSSHHKTSEKGTVYCTIL